MLIIWLLGFTHFLGGPYILFKFIFWIALFPFFIAILFFIIVLLKAKKFFSTKSGRADVNHTHHGGEETIHIEAEIKE